MRTFGISDSLSSYLAPTSRSATFLARKVSALMAEAAEAPPAATRPLMQSALSVDVVKQYSGQMQVDRRVIVEIHSITVQLYSKC